MRDTYLYKLLREIGLSDFSARTTEFILGRPLKVLLIMVLAYLVSRFLVRVGRRFIDRVAARSTGKQTVWAEQRTRTMAGVLSSVIRIIVWSVAIVYLVDAVGLQLGPLVAVSSIVGVALGFGAQTIVRDFLSGFFILVEDQYSVGDVVTVNDKTTGTIEEVNLRMTRLRAVDGTVWFVPNGEIRKVGNAVKDWARALIDVDVPYDADVAAANRAIAEEAAALADDPEWASTILEPPEVWGIEAIGADAYSVRVAVKVVPTRKPAVARALRARLGERLRRDGLIKAREAVMVLSRTDAAEVSPEEVDGEDGDDGV